MRPDADEGAEESEAQADRCAFDPHDGKDDGDPADASFSAEDETAEAFPVEQIAIGISPEDGMPVPVDVPMEDAFAVPFTYDTQLCVEDARVYVEIFKNEFEQFGWRVHWDKDDERPMPQWRKGGVSVFLLDLDLQDQYSVDSGKENERRSFDPDDVQERWGLKVAKAAEGWVPVRPVRPVCRFYKRQVLNSKFNVAPGEFGSQEIFRLCTARRSNGGAFMSLKDSGIFVCDLRDPPDPRSSAEQDDKDLVKLRTRPDQLMVPAFGIFGDAYRKGQD